MLKGLVNSWPSNKEILPNTAAKRGFQEAVQNSGVRREERSAGRERGREREMYQIKHSLSGIFLCCSGWQEDSS